MGSFKRSLSRDFRIDVPKVNMALNEEEEEEGEEGEECGEEGGEGSSEESGSTDHEERPPLAKKRKK